MERHRALYLYIKGKTNFFTEHNKILDISPLQSFQDKCRKIRSIKYLSIDKEPGLAMQQGDITDLKYRNNYFDYVICYHVLEHVHNDIDAIKELYRVIKKGGMAFFHVPIKKGKTTENLKIKPSDYEKYYGQHDHIRVYGYDFKKRLLMGKFRPKIVRLAEEFEDDIIKYHGLIYHDRIYCCKK